MSSRDNTGRKQPKSKEFEAQKWEAGQSGNPKGRPKGARSKFSEVFLKTFLEDFEEHGITAIQEARTKDPAAYVRVAASLLPKELSINEGESALERLLEQHSDDDLNKLIDGISEIGIAAKSSKGKNKKGASERSNSVH